MSKSLSCKLLLAALALTVAEVPGARTTLLPGEEPGPLPGYTCYRMLTAGYSICGTPDNPAQYKCWGNPAVFCVAYDIIDELGG